MKYSTCALTLDLFGIKGDGLTCLEDSRCKGEVGCFHFHPDQNRIVLKIAEGYVFGNEITLGTNLQETGLEKSHTSQLLVEDRNPYFLQHASGREVVHYRAQFLVREFGIVLFKNVLGPGIPESGPKKDQGQKEPGSTQCAGVECRVGSTHAERAR